jgi:hypothetical protein
LRGARACANADLIQYLYYLTTLPAEWPAQAAAVQAGDKMQARLTRRIRRIALQDAVKET